MSKLEELGQLGKQALEELGALEDGDALSAWRRQYLGKKGSLTLMLRAVRDLPPEERPAFGRAANAAKVQLETAYGGRIEKLRADEMARQLDELRREQARGP